jgi:hypothetical protein
VSGRVYTFTVYEFMTSAKHRSPAVRHFFAQKAMCTSFAQTRAQVGTPAEVYACRCLLLALFCRGVKRARPLPAVNALSVYLYKRLSTALRARARARARQPRCQHVEG